MSNKMLKKHYTNVKKLMRNILAWYVRMYVIYTYQCIATYVCMYICM